MRVRFVAVAIKRMGVTQTKHRMNQRPGTDHCQKCEQ
jgi:hypothetical protein